MNSDLNNSSFTRTGSTWFWLLFAAVLWLGVCLWALRSHGYSISSFGRAKTAEAPLHMDSSDATPVSLPEGTNNQGAVVETTTELGTELNTQVTESLGDSVETTLEPALDEAESADQVQVAKDTVNTGDQSGTVAAAPDAYAAQLAIEDAALDNQAAASKKETEALAKADEAARLVAQTVAQAEAELLAAESQAKAAEGLPGAEESARLETEAQLLAAEELAKAEAARLAAEELAKVEEAARLEAVEVAKAEQLAAEELARAEEAAKAELLAAEELAKAEEAARLEAEVQASRVAEQAAKLETEAEAAIQQSKLAEEATQAKIVSAEAQRLAEEQEKAQRAEKELEEKQSVAQIEQQKSDAVARQAAQAEAARIAAAARRQRQYERLREDELSVLQGLSARLRFLPSSFEVSRELEHSLDRMFDPLYLYSELPVMVSVATNESDGSASDNVLSRDRGRAIVAYLVNRGLDKSRFRIRIEAGEALPLGTHRVRVISEETGE